MKMSAYSVCYIYSNAALRSTLAIGASTMNPGQTAPEELSEKGSNDFCCEWSALAQLVEC